MSRLHRALLRSLPLPFVAAFSTLMVLLLLQFLIAYMKDLVGRGLPLWALAELVAYSLAYMVTLAVPMAWLIALLAAFGRLGESRAYLVARSAGVSLPRLAWPVAVVGLGLTLAMGYFNNEMLPEANHRMSGLWRDIRVARPTFALTPGEFYTGIAGYAIRAEAIPPEAPGRLDGVTVIQSRGDDGAQAVVTAARARLEMQGGTRLTMRLEDGEVHRRGGGPPAALPAPGTSDAAPGERYERLAFEHYRIAFALDGLTGFARRAQDDGADSRTDRSMRTSAMLAVVDSLDALARARADSTAAQLDRLGRPYSFSAPPSSALTAPAPGTVAGADLAPAGPTADAAARPDTAAAPPRLGARRRVLDGLDAAERATVYAMAQERARVVRSTADAAAIAAQWDRQRADQFRVEIYKKNSIALACLVFVLVGVPLGLAVSRAGVGLVATLAVFVFLFYWISLVQGEKLADRGLLSPVVGMWAANVLIGVLGLYLFLREARDPAWPDPIGLLAGRFARRTG